MGIVEKALMSIDNYWTGINKNFTTKQLELKIGIPSSWFFVDTELIGCNVLNENKIGKVIVISSKTPETVIDDLIEYAEGLVKANFEVSEKEKEIERIIEEEKSTLENKFKKLYDDLEEIKSKSFNGVKSEKVIDKPLQKKKSTDLSVTDGIKS